MLAGVRLASAVHASNIDIFRYSQLVVKQIGGQFKTSDERMIIYVTKIKEQLGRLKCWKLDNIDRSKNDLADILAMLPPQIYNQKMSRFTGTSCISHLFWVSR